MSTSLLSQLFAPLSADDFLTEYWPTRAFVSHGPLSRVEGADALTLDRILEAFARTPIESKDAVPPEIHVWFSDEAEKGWHTRQRKEECLVDAHAARILHDRKGGNLACYHTEKCMPELAEWCRRLTEETGNPSPFYISTYASPAGAGFQQHFDREETISLQLVGKKKWYWADNEVVKNPTERWMVSNPPWVSPDLSRQLGGRTLPQQMPDGSFEAVLEPGSIVYIPKGWWHKTETSDQASLSVSIQCVVPSAFVIVLTAVRRLLTLKEEWREPIPFVASKDPALRSRGLDRLREAVGKDLGANPLLLEALLAANDE